MSTMESSRIATETKEEPAPLKQSESKNLNELLENALEDLLLKDDEDVAVDHQMSVPPQVSGSNKPKEPPNNGMPNIHESLKKITEINDKEVGRRKTAGFAASRSSKKHPTKSKTATNSANPSSVVDIDEMNRFFANMTEQLQAELPQIDPSETQARLNESVPQIFEMMQTLLSKELLYKALNELGPKYEAWLEKNQETLTEEEMSRYRKQIIKINEIIGVFDDESLCDQERFERNLELMEQMQSLGAPPEELTVPDGMSKCSIM